MTAGDERVILRFQAREMAQIVIIFGLSMLGAGFVFIGVQWWRQGVPVGGGRNLTSAPENASSVVVILLGVALALFGWVWLPSLMR
jgi:hypothetical protein